MNPKDCMRSKEEMKLLADIAELEAENRRLRDALEFIACGCLVPPDGGDPRHPEDCMKAAREALNHGIKPEKVWGDAHTRYGGLLSSIGWVDFIRSIVLVGE